MTSRALPPAELARIGPLLGETAWHSITVDATIADRSREILARLRALLAAHRDACRPRQVLEVASYAMTHGHALAAELAAEVTLFDVSPSTLALGRELAGPATKVPRLVAGDFHDLPFEDAAFDFVFLCSALHHTRDWQRVLGELQRVLAPGGLLYLDNEPCARACCCHRFETNRPEEFTPFEQQLDRLGLLQTIAQPFAGSRAEALFHIVENQRIELPELLAQVGRDMELLDLQLDVATQIGPLEAGWLAARPRGLAERIRTELTRGCAAAAAQLDERARGLGFTLPAPAEIDALATRIADRIARLPRPPLRRRWLQRWLGRGTPLSPPASIRQRVPQLRPGDARQQGLAELFGASLRVLARKHGTPSAEPHGRMRGRFPVHDRIHRAFTPALATMLDRYVRLFTPPSGDDRGGDWTRFASDDWQHSRSDQGVHSMLLRAAAGRVRLPRRDAAAIVMLRCHGAPPPAGAATVTVDAGATRLFRHDLWQPESFLCVARIEPDDGDELRIGVASAGPAHLSVAVATLHPLPAPALSAARVP
jgi:ubiquinone/menaquinone biosynthesis C-methylase UbiE